MILISRVTVRLVYNGRKPNDRVTSQWLQCSTWQRDKTHSSLGGGRGYLSNGAVRAVSFFSFRTLHQSQLLTIYCNDAVLSNFKELELINYRFPLRPKTKAVWYSSEIKSQDDDVKLCFFFLNLYLEQQ